MRPDLAVEELAVSSGRVVFRHREIPVVQKTVRDEQVVGLVTGNSYSLLQVVAKHHIEKKGPYCQSIRGRRGKRPEPFHGPPDNGRDRPQ
jgi:hypothetical protein